MPEIISADSRQVYRGMDIGTGKDLGEYGDVPYHLIDIADPGTQYNVFQFCENFAAACQDITGRGALPILCGGTGLYIELLLTGRKLSDGTPDERLRAELFDYAEKHGAEALHGMLAEEDPEAAAAIHPNNIRRVIRALEFSHQTGMRISEHNRVQRKKESPYLFCYFVLTQDRERVYERINRRVDLMLEEGLEAEVRRLRDMGMTPDMTSMKGLGYAEMLRYLSGEIQYEEAVRLIKRNTRHFAKRQLTWFRREKDVIWIDRDDYGCDDGRILEAMTDILRGRGILS
jgi:tRNA dimethylallyltransferase